jgi:hypothetical protein
MGPDPRAARNSVKGFRQSATICRKMAREHDLQVARTLQQSQ